jgi:hypothetical protein
VPAQCRRGWHARLDKNGVVYVRFGTRMRDEQGTFIYRIGPVPHDDHCVTVWCYADEGVAWTCSLCGRPIIGLRAAAPHRP